MQQVWKLQNARLKFGQVVEQAIAEGPQIITRYGVEAAVVLSYEEYRWMFVRQKELSDLVRDSAPSQTPPQSWPEPDR